MLGIPLGLLYANASEWLIHKYVLHGLGKKKKSFFAFHWTEHHRACRKHGFYDPDYERSMFGEHAQGKEALGVAALMIAHLPLWPVAPWFTATVWYAAVKYLYTHRRAHLDPEWARKHLRHHYDHHMGREQDANWCVTQPWFDYLMRTRIAYEYDAEGRPIRVEPQPKLIEELAEQLLGAVKDDEKSAA